MAIVIGIGNRVGGVGKTTTTVALAYTLSKQGNRVLIIDSDGQGDCNFLLKETYGEFKHDAGKHQTLYTAYMSGSLDGTINQVIDNLDLIKSDDQIESVDVKSASVDVNTRSNMLSTMLRPYQDKYDYVLLDLPPAASSVLSTNGLFAADYVLIPAQTAPKDIRNTYMYIGIIQSLRQDYNLKIELAGVLPCFLHPSDESDLRQKQKLEDKLGDVVFKTSVMNRKRIMYFFEDGLTFNERDTWDRDWMEQYQDVATELKSRIKELSK